MVPHHTDVDIDAARAEIHAAMMAAFCSVLHASRLPPMTVLGMVANAAGAIYKEIADEHRREACPCGWHPHPHADVPALQAALAATAQTMPPSDLRVVRMAGRA